jgi:hypothetical protein
MDKHLAVLARQYFDTRFIKISAPVRAAACPARGGLGVGRGAALGSKAGCGRGATSIPPARASSQNPPKTPPKTPNNRTRRSSRSS